MTTKKFETKNIKEATPEEIRSYAQFFLGIPVEGLSEGEVLAKATAAMEGETIFVAVAEGNEPVDQTGPVPPNVENKGAKMAGGLGHDDPKVTLTLHAEEKDGVIVSRHKEVGINGIFWLLKRGESITIPYRIFKNLNDAVRDVVTHDKEGNERHQRVHNTPFNIERMPSPEEIKAWHQRTDDLLNP